MEPCPFIHSLISMCIKGNHMWLDTFHPTSSGGKNTELNKSSQKKFMIHFKTVKSESMWTPGCFGRGLPASHGKAEEPEHRPIYGIRDVLRWSRLRHLTFRCHLSRVKSLVNTRLELFGRGNPPFILAVAPICRPITPTFFIDQSL